MREKSLPKKSRIIDLLFSGKTYRKIAKLEGVSVGVISRIYKEFVDARAHVTGIVGTCMQASFSAYAEILIV